MKYRGITHMFPHLVCNRIFCAFWNRILCSREMHLFDEVYGTCGHYLVCDVCGLTVHIGSIEEDEEEEEKLEDYDYGVGEKKW